jgi:AraC family transcriptional regulator
VNAQISQVVFDSGIIQIGAFRCRPDHPLFHEAGQPSETCFFVFPRTAVEIQHEREAPFVANPNVVTFYNPGQAYRRNAISPEGDLCDWFAVETQFARDLIREIDLCIDDRPAWPFFRSRAWSDTSTYLLQRRLFTRIASGRSTEPLAVEETVVELLGRVTRSAYATRGVHLLSSITPRQRDTVHDIETVLSRPPEERLTLKGIARDVGLSPYHVCRIFRRATGKTLHHYRLQFRLRTALTQVLESTKPLTDVALDGGFSSHSHFTDRFRHAFGETPSLLRTGLNPSEKLTQLDARRKEATNPGAGRIGRDKGASNTPGCEGTIQSPFTSRPIPSTRQPLAPRKRPNGRLNAHDIKDLRQRF